VAILLPENTEPATEVNGNGLVKWRSSDGISLTFSPDGTFVNIAPALTRWQLLQLALDRRAA